MTVKAGQKCTAIRRAIVPRRTWTRWPEAACRGWPRWSWATRRWRACAWARWPRTRNRPTWPTRGPAAPGAETGVTRWRRLCAAGRRHGRRRLLRAHAAAARNPLGNDAVHDVEAFGPVSTLMAYDGPGRGAGAGRARPGQPGRHAGDKAPGGRREGHPAGGRLARPAAGAGPRGGGRVHRPRLAAAAAQARRPGPRRRRRGAGRPARRQALPAALRRCRARRPCWRRSPASTCAGAKRIETGVHPFRRHFEDLQIGESLLTHRRTVGEADIVAFGGISGDYFYMHFDEVAAKERPSASASRTATSCCRRRPGLFVSPRRARCWPTTGWTRCASSSRWASATPSRRG
jgi:oxepin-CoA hydrolase/3-oxo-5,6-dehydrosuberyl-CoA semialdehyde dehydrogenase